MVWPSSRVGLVLEDQVEVHRIAHEEYIEDALFIVKDVIG